MDFAKPSKAPGTRHRPPDYEAPGVNDLETGPGADFRIEDNILPDSPGKASNVSSPMDITNLGPDSTLSLAARLHWRTSSPKRST